MVEIVCKILLIWLVFRPERREDMREIIFLLAEQLF
jgi:hypothetical protein